MRATNVESRGRLSANLQTPGMLVKICTTPTITETLNRIASASSRSIPEIIRYFIRKSEKDIGWSRIVCYNLPIKNWYDSPPIRTRLPRPWYMSLHDLAWKHGVHFKTQGSRIGGASYLVGLCCHVQLNNHPADFWITHFLTGQDIIETIGATLDERSKSK